MSLQGLAAHQAQSRLPHRAPCFVPDRQAPILPPIPTRMHPTASCRCRGWLRTKRDLAGPTNYLAVLQTAQEVASAMHYLHARGIIHGDLTGNNVSLGFAALGWLLSVLIMVAGLRALLSSATWGSVLSKGGVMSSCARGTREAGKVGVHREVMVSYGDVMGAP